MSDLDIARLWGELTSARLDIQQMEEELAKKKASMLEKAHRLKALCEMQREPACYQ